MIVINCLLYQLIQTEVKIVSPACDLCPHTQIAQTTRQPTRQLQRICLRIGIRMVYAVCQRQRQEKFHKAGVARMRARMKPEAREKVDTSSTNTDLQPIPRWSLLISSSATESCPPLGEYSRK